jgi:hypothetical protein
MLTNFFSDIGKLDRKICIMCKRFGQPNELGIKDEYFDENVVSAALAIRNQRSQDTDVRVNHNRILQFIIRYKEVNIYDKVRYQHKAYNITDIEEIGRKRFLKITCEWIE